MIYLLTMRAIYILLLIPMVNFLFAQPDIELSYEKPVCIGSEVEFDAGGSCCDPVDIFIDYGDGTKDTLLGQDPDGFNVSYEYNIPGTFFFKFKLDDGVDADSLLDTFVVYDRPVVDFLPSEDTLCFSDNALIDFTNLTTSINTPVTYQWYMGNGDQSTEEHTSSVYSQPGRYRVLLRAYSDTALCSSQTTKDIFIVDDTALANFEIQQECPCNEFNFTNTTAEKNDIVSWQWIFGNDSVSIAENPDKQKYLDPGQYYVSLIGTKNDGCKHIRRKLVNVCPEEQDTLPNTASNNRWYFGTQAGIDFNGGVPVALLNAPSTFVNPTNEGRATVSDHLTGDLLFWVSDSTIYNRDQQPMPNSTNLLYGTSSSQGPLIVPHPGNDNQYFVFRTFGWTGELSGLYFCLVDMSLDGGKGDIVIKDSMLIGTVPFFPPYGFARSEHLTGTAKSLGECGEKISYWVVTHYIENTVNIYNYYLVDERGITLDHSQTIPHIHGTIGQSAFSPDGTKYALVSLYQGIQYSRSSVFIYDFDKENGLLLPNPVIDYNVGGLYGLAFSPDNSKLYFTDRVASMSGTGYAIKQLDLSADDILASEQIIYTDGKNHRSMYLGPDDKIYVALFNHDSIGVINNPNVLGVACNYVENGVYLGGGGRICGMGLQNLLPKYSENNEIDTSSVEASFVIDEIQCDEVFLRNVSDSLFPPQSDSCDYPHYYLYRWSFSDGESDSIFYCNSDEFSQVINHVYDDSGTYEVSLIVSSSFSCDQDTFTENIIIGLSDSFNSGKVDTQFCVGEGQVNIAAREGILYEWLPINGLSCVDCQSPTIQVDSSIVYVAEIRDELGCQLTDSIVVTALNCDVFLPNAFSPDNDGMNDWFGLYHVSAEVFDSYELNIFNRHGTRVFQSNDVTRLWDGNHNKAQEKYPEGVYTYYLKYSFEEKEIETVSGNVTLLR